MAVRAAGAYPPVQVQGKHPVYAEMMLGNIGGANSEMSALAHYRYAHVMIDDPHIAQLAHQISVVEMQHFDTFARLAKLLGADPRMWQSYGGSKKYWSPGYVKYGTCSLHGLLQQLIQEEHDAILKYNQQAAYIQDPLVVESLARIIEDEQEHWKTWQEEFSRL